MSAEEILGLTFLNKLPHSLGTRMEAIPHAVQRGLKRRSVADQYHRPRPGRLSQLGEFALQLFLGVFARRVEWRRGRVSKTCDFPPAHIEAAFVKVIQPVLLAHIRNLRR